MKKFLVLLCALAIVISFCGCESTNQTEQTSSIQMENQVDIKESLQLDELTVLLVNNSVSTFADTLNIMNDYGVTSSEFYDFNSVSINSFSTYTEQMAEIAEENKSMYFATANALIAEYGYYLAIGQMLNLGDVSYAGEAEEIYSQIAEHEQSLPEWRIKYLKSIGLTDEEIEQRISEFPLLVEIIHQDK